MRSRLLSAVLLGVAFGGLNAGDAAAGKCLKDAREVRLDRKNVVRLSDYLCRSDSDPNAVIRVQFQRLTGLSAGVIVNGGSAPWMSALYGKYRLVDNDVLREYKKLIAQFGSPVRERISTASEITIGLSLGTPAQRDAGEATYLEGGKGDSVRSFQLLPLPDVPLVDEAVHILNERTWPASLHMYYDTSGFTANPGENSAPPSLMNLITLWRYLTPQDLKEYSKRVQRYNSLVVDRQYGTIRPAPKSVQLVEYLTSGGWPENFLVATANVVDDSTGCSVLDFTITQYEVDVEVAVIENVSQKPLKLDRLFGRAVADISLREIVTPKGPQLDAPELGFSGQTVASGEKLIVPTSINFRSQMESVRPSGSEDDRSNSTKHFQAIMNKSPGTVISIEVISPLRGRRPGKDDTFVIEKVRESFKEPAYPRHSDFVFGPEWALSGVAVNGEKILFEQSAPNFIDLTAGNPVGSCPILYAWDGTTKEWIRHGKIIHQARSRTARMSESIEFAGLITRFRVVEEELERATIDQMILRLQLKDGNTLVLRPEPASLREIDDHSVELYANDELEIDFPLPPGLASEEVVRTILTVAGHYDRYPALLAARR